MDLGIKGKRAAVAAGSAGLGLGTARALVEAGVQVAICGRDPERLAAAAESLGQAAHPLVADVSTVEGATGFVEAAVESLGGLDILVTNAGGPPLGKFADLDDAQWHLSFQELFMSVVQATRAVRPLMAEQRWGRIVMVTSIAGKEPAMNLTLSNALRAGVHGLMNTLSKELGPDGITVNAVLPTYTETDRLKQFRGSFETMAKQIPVGRLGQPEEMAKLVAYLCSDSAGFISGQAIGFDGGSMHSV